MFEFECTRCVGVFFCKDFFDECESIVPFSLGRHSHGLCLKSRVPRHRLDRSRARIGMEPLCNLKRIIRTMPDPKATFQPHKVA